VKTQILNAYGERMSLRGIQRVFGVWRGTLLRWLEQLLAELPSLPETLLPVEANDVLEMDELVSFVAEKWFKRWLWTAQCRRTRQIVAYAIGDRSETTARKLWGAIPSAYRACPVFTDEYNVYPLIVPQMQHHPTPKGSGAVNHQERWYNSLRQALGRYTRRTLSFSKDDRYHELVTRWFILRHNLAIQQAPLTM
jgi:IS1 family transposase